MIDVLIVENEASSAAALNALISTLSNVRVNAICSSVGAASEQIRKNRPQIVLLDVELDGESGFDLLERFPSPGFEIIFITAYSSYALRAIKHACLDYLLKPVDLDELKLAFNKFSQKEHLTYSSQLQLLLENIRHPKRNKVSIPVSGGYEFINLADIVMCRAEANYSTIFCKTGEKIVCSKNLGSLEDMIDDKDFFRCHKSFLINIQHIRKFWQRERPHVVLLNDLEAEVSLRKKDKLLELVRASSPKGGAA